MDGIVMKIALLIIFAILVYFGWSWWNGREVVIPSVIPKTENLDVTAMRPPAAAPHMQDDIPQGPGITMYGTDDCPWCQKQKDYFIEKKIEYIFKDCSKGECPGFVSGYPTLVRDGRVMPGYQEI